MKNLLLELENLKEASRPSVERKFDENGVQSTGIPVSLFIYFCFKINSNSTIFYKYFVDKKANTQIQSKLSTHKPTNAKKVKEK